MSRALVCLFSSLLLPLAVAADDPQEAREFSFVRETTLNYLIARPDGYEEQESWPLVIFLHGAGERGANLELVKTHGPPKLVKQGRELPFVLVSPQCPKDDWWDARDLLLLLDEIEKTERIDPDRIYATGLSMGGYGTWSLAAMAPDRFAAIAPVCGGGIPYLASKNPKLPVWMFHGTADFVVPFALSEMMADAIRRRGGEPKFTIYEGVGHDSWTEAYNTDELYEWLLSKRLSDRIKEKSK